MEEQPSMPRGIKRLIPEELKEQINLIDPKVPRVTAKSADLDDNQKRWLIVGICLHTILSPALRKYVVSILTVLYNELTIKQNIDTQTSQTYLKRYPPTNTFLNYETVNNNKATYGIQEAEYDYTIKNVVDLSKLFLQTHMAHYTGFDESCDLSAVLGLIINIDKFDPVIKSDAKDVRRNIRNLWAHCDFTKWDAVNYSSSFKLMKKLIKDLKLNINEQRKILKEIKKWKTTGQHFVSGATVSLELVNDIRQHTHVLAEYTKLVENETDDNSMKIKQVLENFDILLNRLKQLDKDMKTFFLEIPKNMTAKLGIALQVFKNTQEIGKNVNTEITAIKAYLHNVKVSKYEADQLERQLQDDFFGKWKDSCVVMKATQIPTTGIQSYLNHLEEAYEGINKSLRKKMEGILFTDETWEYRIVEWNSDTGSDYGALYGIMTFEKSPDKKYFNWMYAMCKIDFKISKREISTEKKHTILFGMHSSTTKDVETPDRKIDAKSVKALRNFLCLKALQGFYNEGVTDSICYVDSLDDIP